MKPVRSGSFTTESVMLPMDELASERSLGIRELRKAISCHSHLLIALACLHATDLFSDLCRETSVFLFWGSLVLALDVSLTSPRSWYSAPCYQRRRLILVFRLFAWNVLFPPRIYVNADGIGSWDSENWWLWLFQLHLSVTLQLGGPVELSAGSGSWRSELADLVYAKVCLSIWWLVWQSCSNCCWRLDKRQI